MQILRTFLICFAIFSKTSSLDQICDGNNSKSEFWLTSEKLARAIVPRARNFSASSSIKLFVSLANLSVNLWIIIKSISCKFQWKFLRFV
ncbi:hypothetical protein MFC_01385 [Mesomycoplasma flocculare ATCC 27716]|nr:hypothetical protein MFC_01385 [Mesomycoplasma flocculare ATCC 27716]